MEESQVLEPQGFDSFPPDIREDVDGLVWLGYLEDDFEFCGHQFTIRTLRGDEELLAAQLTKEYVETLGQSRAWAWAIVALSLVAVDGDEAFCPPAGPDKRNYARARFNYVTSKWYWLTARTLFDRYTALQERQAKALEAVEDLSPGNLTTFTPFAGFSTDRGDSQEEPPNMREVMEAIDQDSTESNQPS